MPKIDERLSRKPVKRLQTNPKLQEKIKHQKVRSVIVIQRLISKLMNEDVELVMKSLKVAQIEELEKKKKKS